MRSSGLRALAVLAAACGLAVACASPAYATSRTVCQTGCDATTIQGAVDLSGVNDIIAVAPGTYTETVVVPPNKDGLSFRGAQAGVAPQGRSGPESELDPTSPAFLVEASHVTIDGFKIHDGQVGVFWSSATSGNSVLNTAFLREGNAIVADSNGVALDLIAHNSFVDAGTGGFRDGDAIFADATKGNLVVEHNLFRNAPRAAVETAVTESPADVTVTDNEVDGDTNGGLLFIWHARNVTVARNTITDPHNTTGMFLDDIAHAAVTDNTVTGSSILQPAITLAAFGFAAEELIDIDVERNDLSNNSSGILVEGGGTVPGDVEVHFNRFAGNSGGAIFSNTGTVDARQNWWGCNAGPNQAGCDRASAVGAMQTSPWLVLTLGAPDRVVARPGATAPVTATVLNDSDGNSFGARAFPAAPIAFATSAGSLAPLSAPLVSGTASTLLTDDASSGADVTATLDNQTVRRHVAFGPAPPIGPTGAQGVAGAPGDAGDPGAAGAPGATGNPGGKGDSGPPGLPGDKGDTGPQGVQGVAGSQGPPGPQGKPGSCTVAALFVQCAVVNTTAAGAATVSLYARSGYRAAAARVTVRRSASKVLRVSLRASHALRPGRYVLVVHRGKHRLLRQVVTVRSSS